MIGSFKSGGAATVLMLPAAAIRNVPSHPTTNGTKGAIFACWRKRKPPVRFVISVENPWF
jgi:hypothetical protein